MTAGAGFSPKSHTEAISLDGDGDKRMRVLKYRQIRDWLVERIYDGTYRRFEQLPSEHEVMAIFGVSRVTARQAFDAMREMGLVEARRGKGHFVSDQRATATLERLQSFGEMMAPLHLPTHSDVIELREVCAAPDIAAELGLAEGALVIRLVRARKAASTTVSLDTSYLPLTIGRRLLLLDLTRRDVFTLMERQLGIDIDYADLIVDVADIPPEFAKLLGLSDGEKAIRLRRKTVASGGRPVMFEFIHARSDRLQFRVRMPRA